MRILRESGNYLRRKALRNLILAILCFVGFAGIFATSIDFLPLYVNVDRYENVRTLSLLFPLIFGLYFLRQHGRYRQGYKGEDEVTRVLSSALSDDYHLINDVIFSDGYGNIDHIVLGPNGLFTIETKNHRGKIKCYGDHWSWQYRRANRTGLDHSTNIDLGSSPSKQVKMNVVRVKRALRALDAFGLSDVWINGAVVFSNPNVDLEIIEPPPNVDILRVQELPEYIRTKKSRNHFSQKEIDLIGEEILKQTQNHSAPAKPPQQ